MDVLKATLHCQAAVPPRQRPQNVCLDSREAALPPVPPEASLLTMLRHAAATCQTCSPLRVEDRPNVGNVSFHAQHVTFEDALAQCR